MNKKWYQNLLDYQETNDGYTITFEVFDPIPPVDLSLYHGGYLTCYGTNSLNDLNVFNGFVIENIREAGFYELVVNFGSQTSVWEIVQQPDNSNIILGSAEDAGWNTGLPQYENMLAFVPQGTGFSGSISNVTLIDNTNYFSGGGIDAWTFDGFDTAFGDDIYWDSINESIVFNTSDAINTPVQIEQAIEEELLVGESYLVTFDFTWNIAFEIPPNNEGFSPFESLSDGVVPPGMQLVGYYFNEIGEGFSFFINNYDVCEGICYASNTSGTYSECLEVGSDSINPTTDFQFLGSNMIQTGDELVNTFVISTGQTSDVFVTIDNFSLKRCLSPEEKALHKTISYSEDVKGWVSFKSFIPESGVSCSKEYYTFYAANIWRHHAEDLDDNGDLIVDRNSFYGWPHPTASRVEFLLNQSTSVVKSFKTLNYEGSHARIKQIQIAPGTSLSNINDSNAISPNMYATGSTVMDLKAGWQTTYFETDLQKGSASEFVEKEGKWFSHVTGDTLGNPSSMDMSAFSFQGLGIALSVDEVIEQGEDPTEAANEFIPGS
jgi:hypothetical protein